MAAVAFAARVSRGSMGSAVLGLRHPSGVRGIVFNHRRFEVDAWEVLGIARGTEKGGIKSAYKRAALRTHPDMPQGSAEAFRRVEEAYQHLMEPEKRLMDMLQSGQAPKWRPDSPPIYEDRGPFRSVSDEVAEDIFQKAFGRGVESMVREEMAKVDFATGVYGKVIYEGLFVELLARAKRILEAEEVRRYTMNTEESAIQQVKVTRSRESTVDIRGRPVVRYKTSVRFPNGRTAESITEKMVFRM